MTSAMLSSDILYNQLLASMSGKSLLLGGGNEFHPCCKCGATFGDAKSLTKHELSHQKRKHECKECGKRFNSSSDLKRHSLIHTNTRPYKCHLCPTAFVQQAHLTRHLKSHTRHGVRFKCLGCGTMFLHSTNVRWHQQFCEQAQGTNGGYVVTQSEGEGMDTSSPIKPAEKNTTKPLWSRDNKVYYFNGKDRRHSSSSSETETNSTSGSTDSGSEPGSNSFLNCNKAMLFDGLPERTNLWNQPKVENEVKKERKTNLSASQLSYLNSRVSMVGPKHLKTTSAKKSLNQPASTEDLLKLLASMQEGKKSNKVGTVSPNAGSLNPHLSNSSCFNMQKTSPPSSYKIVQNKIIQHNVTSSNNLMTSSNNLLTSSNNFMSSSNNFMTSSNNIMTSSNKNMSTVSPGLRRATNSSINSNKMQEDKIKPIIDLVNKLVAEGLQSPAADTILNVISRYLGNVTSPQTNVAPQIPTSTSLPPLKKRRLSEPEQERLLNNLETSQNLFSNNLYPLLHQQGTTSTLLTPTATPSSSLSFTPLMFRQFPRIGDLPTQSSLFNSPSFKPSTAFASQLLQLANQNSSALAPGLKLTTGGAKLIHNGFPGPMQSGAAYSTSAVNTSEVRKPPKSTSDLSSKPMKVEDASPRDESQPIIKQEMVSHDSREPMGGEETGVAGPESSPAGPGQGAPELVKGIEASQNIAFHRLSDLLSFV